MPDFEEEVELPEALREDFELRQAVRAHRDIGRRFNPKETAFQSEDSGSVIKSPRKFGLELEIINAKDQNIYALSQVIDTSFGIENDGSIITENKERSIEVITPILSGNKGEEAVRNLYEKVNSFEFKVNASCGLHAHLDGAGFKKSDDTTCAPLSTVPADTILSKTREDNIFVVNKKLLDKLVKITDGTGANVARMLIDEFKSTGRKTLYLGRILGTTAPDVVIRNGVMDIGKYSFSVDYYDYADSFKIPVDESPIKITIDDLKINPNDYLCIIHGDNSLANLKSLLFVYSVFNDVFMAMLPKSRRNNVYCQNLALSFSPNQINSIGSHTELETAWYKTKSIVETESRKHNHYDDSRYYGVNLHSLFAKYGTVEIRSHSATLAPNKALYWVALHQEILDKIVSGHVSLQTLKGGAYLDTLEEKVEFLISAFSFRTSIRKYIKQRIQYFTDNIK